MDVAEKHSRTDQDWLNAYLPDALRSRTLDKNTIPQLAKDPPSIAQIDGAIRSVPTKHSIHKADARDLDWLPDNSVHLVLTSPPYWTLKEYREGDGQLGFIQNYTAFLAELDKVWAHCYRTLVPGGRLVIVVGDVCLSRKKNKGEHTVVPLHASIQEHCREAGFSNLAPIIWHKIANARFEVGGGGGFLGKPYEPNAVIKNDVEFILMQRKRGGYRNPGTASRLLSVISAENHRAWFQQIWMGLTGASTRHHPAPFPEELASRLISMFSFVGDTVLDPFMGTGTTSLAATKCGRNSIGVDVEPHYFEYARTRIEQETSGLFGDSKLEVHDDFG